MINNPIVKNTTETDKNPKHKTFNLVNLSAKTPPIVQKIIKRNPWAPAKVPTQNGESVNSNVSQP